MTNQQLITFSVALLAILNPIGNAALYIGMIHDRSRRSQRKIAFVCSIAIAVILILVTWIGLPLLNLFGISVASFQTAGGLIIILIGLSMMRGHVQLTSRGGNLQNYAQTHKDSIAVVPLAMPIIAGPGAISTIIGHGHLMHTTLDKLKVTGIDLLMAVILWAVLFFSPYIARGLGEYGMKIVTRVMGLVLTAIAVQMFATGLVALMPGLAGLPAIGHNMTAAWLA